VRLLLALAGVTLTLSGCGEPERPPPAGDVNVGEPAPSDDVGLAPSAPAPPDLASPCGASTIALEYRRPSLYFALDASGSMLDAIPRGDSAAYPELGAPDNRYEALGDAIETVLERIGHRTSYGAVLFPASGYSCGSGDEILELQAGDTVSYALANQHGPVLSRLMSRIHRHEPGGGTPVAEALSAIAPRLANVAGERYVFLLTDGGPNCNPDIGCAIDSCIPNIERIEGSDGFRCDGTVNCCSEALLGAGNCLDSSGSLKAITALSELGIQTFVIGMPGSGTYAGLLDELAVAGGTARDESPAYYSVSDAAELLDTVSALGAKVGLSCSVPLTEPPPDPDLVNVYFDGQLIAQDPLDGWTWSDDRTVTIVGEACALLEARQVLQLDVVAGCPVVIR
jgi:hypothetical protein